MSKRFTAEELAKFREIAEAATPGPWAVNPWQAVVDEMETLTPICGMLWPTELRTEEQTLANAQHIAAFDPTTVLALLDEIERLRRIETAAKRVRATHPYDHRRVIGLCDCSLCRLSAALDGGEVGDGE